MAGDEDIKQELRDVAIEVAELRAETERENELRAKRIKTAEEAIEGQKSLTRRALLVAAAAVVVALIASAAAAVAIISAIQSNHALSAEKERTVEARLGSCLQQRKTADIAIAASHSHDVVLSDTLAPGPRTDATQALVDTYLDKAHRSDVIENRKRDCSPQGIVDFLSGRGGYEVPPTTATTAPSRG